MLESYLVAEKAARDVDLLAPNHDNFLATKDLLGDDRGQSTKEVTLAINYDGCRRECGHREVCEIEVNIHGILWQKSGGERGQT